MSHDITPLSKHLLSHIVQQSKPNLNFFTFALGGVAHSTSACITHNNCSHRINPLFNGKLKFVSWNNSLIYIVNKYMQSHLIMFIAKWTILTKCITSIYMPNIRNVIFIITCMQSLKRQSIFW